MRSSASPSPRVPNGVTTLAHPNASVPQSSAVATRTAAAVVRHMADLEARGLITHTGTMFTDALAVLERDGEDAMVAGTHETYGNK